MVEYEILKRLQQIVQEGDAKETVEMVKEALEKGISPLDAINKGLAVGIREVGEKFENLEVFLTDLVIAGDAMQAGVDYLRKIIEDQGLELENKGIIVIGTVKGDVHNIGKNILASLLVAEGFEVHDIGVDVSTYTFFEKAEEYNADIVAMSALLSTTMIEIQDMISLLKEENKRTKYLVVIGGSPVTEEFQREIGADGYAPNAIHAVKMIKEIIIQKKKGGK